MTRPESGDGGGFPAEWNDYGDREHGTWFEFNSDRSVQRSDQRRETESGSTTSNAEGEQFVSSYVANDQVSLKSAVTGVLGGTKVPAGTRGRVVSTRDGVFTSYVTVSFDNGYTEEVKKADLKKVGWFG